MPAIECCSQNGRGSDAETEADCAVLGQYLFYEKLLELVEPDRKLYLAITQETFEQVFSREALQEVTEKAEIALLVVDDDKEDVVLWKS